MCTLYHQEPLISVKVLKKYHQEPLLSVKVLNKNPLFRKNNWPKGKEKKERKNFFKVARKIRISINFPWMNIFSTRKERKNSINLKEFHQRWTKDSPLKFEERLKRISSKFEERFAPVKFAIKAAFSNE